MKIIDQRKRESCKLMEKQNKMLLTRQEEENLELLLQQRQDEEMKQKQRLDMLQREEAFMRREMEEAERQLKYRTDTETYPKIYTEPQRDTKPGYRVEVDVHPKREREEQTERKREDEFERRDDRQMHLLQNQSILNQQEALVRREIDVDERQNNNRTETKINQKQCRGPQFYTVREEQLQRKEEYLKQLEEELNRKENEIRGKLHLDLTSERVKEEQSMRPDTEKGLEKADRTESKKKTDDRDMTLFPRTKFALKTGSLK